MKAVGVIPVTCLKAKQKAAVLAKPASDANRATGSPE